MCLWCTHSDVFSAMIWIILSVYSEQESGSDKEEGLDLTRYIKEIFRGDTSQF